MLVVADTTPLNYLVLIGAIHVLPQMFDRIVVPPAVIAELQHPGTPAPVSEWSRARPAWLEVVSPTAILEVGLGPGESEALSLCEELHAGAILIDERDGRELAERRGLRTIGTVSILDAAGERRLIDVATAVSRLRGTTFRAASSLYALLLERDRKRRLAEP